jgi:hypothetical protein
MERIGRSVQRAPAPTAMRPDMATPRRPKSTGRLVTGRSRSDCRYAEQTAKAWIDQVLLFLMPAVPVTVQVSAALG